MKLGILLIGATGRLGSKIASLLKEHPSFYLVQAIGSNKSSLPHNITPYLQNTDIVLDVATPQSVQENLQKIADAQKPFVIGSSGHTHSGYKNIVSYSKKIPIFLSSNFAYGISILKYIIPKLPKGHYTCLDKHHAHKKDAPSATALDFVQHLPSSCEITSIREGSCIGEHTIHLSLENEEIEITHKAKNRNLFATGALHACQFLYQKDKGLYTCSYNEEIEIPFESDLKSMHS